MKCSPSPQLLLCSPPSYITVREWTLPAHITPGWGWRWQSEQKGASCLYCQHSSHSHKYCTSPREGQTQGKGRGIEARVGSSSAAARDMQLGECISVGLQNIKPNTYMPKILMTANRWLSEPKKTRSVVSVAAKTAVMSDLPRSWTRAETNKWMEQTPGRGALTLDTFFC